MFFVMFLKILSLVLFPSSFILILDVLLSPSANLILFTDSILLSQPYSYLSDYSLAQTNVNSISPFCLLSVNSAKIKYMFISLKLPSFLISVSF